jgi:hypothetical protein
MSLAPMPGSLNVTLPYPGVTVSGERDISAAQSTRRTFTASRAVRRQILDGV